MVHFQIVTPCRNAARYLDQAITSVVTQAGSFTIHYHIQDGGSTDETLSKLKAWEKALASPDSPFVQCGGVFFSWSSAPDDGMYDAIETGFKKLPDQYDAVMGWLNADDVYYPSAFSTVMTLFEEAPEAQWVGGMVAVLGKNAEHVPTPVYNYYPRDIIRAGCCDGIHWPHLQQHGMFWTRCLWNRSGGLDTELRHAADSTLWPRFAEHAELHHLSSYIAFFRTTPGQLSSDRAAYEAEMAQVCSVQDRQHSFFRFVMRHLLPPSVPVYLCTKDWSLKHKVSRSCAQIFFYYRQVVSVVFLRPVKLFVKRMLKISQ
ncbi:glycosyl transferase family 2 [Oleidesulfovibrio alaskensis G20]|uniref:Glycosyl transferase family 2 n=1 Tax=Oleidesulfovibrio alaskensis (strain ATCC BAA-1058 / DSM 17464 / G20) TaxID=207559 RepID=Q30XC2_OLEA2|nr:glycosyltransferase [Oleidesulfovibrio alaskensis]ABB39674.2 glycosyl transferase family 2 [Oleidesulfovibrio alaskensis G20]